MGERTPQIAVIGGGLSGMVGAYKLAQQLPTAKITVIDQAEYVGGKLRTLTTEHSAIELGAEAFIIRRPEALELVRELGLENQLHYPGTYRPALLCGDGMKTLPAGHMLGVPYDADAVSELFSQHTLNLIRSEQDTPLQWSVGHDCSLGEFVASRLGEEVLTRLLDPLVGGVYAAPSRELSLRATLPALAAALDRGAGSITAALTGGPSAAPGPVFASLQGGFATLMNALRAASGANMLLQTTVERVQSDPQGGYLLTLSGGEAAGVHRCDGVLLALPMPEVARVCSGDLHQVGQLASEVECASSALVTFALDSSVFLPQHSGVLISSDAGYRAKAVTFSTQKWPTQPHEHQLVRVSFGRLRDDDILNCSDEQLMQLALEELHKICGLCGAEESFKPLWQHVQRWDECLPCPPPLHHRWVESIDTHSRAFSAFAVAGAAMNGVGIPACIARASSAATELSTYFRNS